MAVKQLDIEKLQHIKFPFKALFMDVVPEELLNSKLYSYLECVQVHTAKSFAAVDYEKHYCSKQEKGKSHCQFTVFMGAPKDYIRNRSEFYDFLKQHAWQQPDYMTGMLKDTSLQNQNELNEIVNFIVKELDWKGAHISMEYKQVPISQISEINLPLEKLVDLQGNRRIKFRKNKVKFP